MTKEEKKYMGDFLELQEFFEGALLRTLLKNKVLSQKQKEDFAEEYEKELDNGNGFTLYEQ